jgi:predicted amidophosphoribosyltransferase
MNAFTCPNCGKSTMGWENYCVDCGAPLNIECPVCNEVWRYMFIYNYCPNCGHDMKVEIQVTDKTAVTTGKTNYTKKEIKK